MEARKGSREVQIIFGAPQIRLQAQADIGKFSERAAIKFSVAST